MSRATRCAETSRPPHRREGAAWGPDSDGWYVIAPVDPGDERMMWFGPDPSDGAADPDGGCRRGDRARHRRKLMRHAHDEITAARVMRDGHLQDHAAGERRIKEGRDI